MCSLGFQLPFCLAPGGGRLLGEVACMSPTGRVSGEMEKQVQLCPSLPTRPGSYSTCQNFGYGVVLFLKSVFKLQLKAHEN